ncbi:MAG: DUF503 domain-containing protein [Synergistaceae bacterium]|nr:DUF503 domain-containing protein [Synergistaceae bacterium]
MLRNRGGETPLQLGGVSCYFGILLVEFQIPWSRSLKDRRQVVRSLLEKLRRGANVSASDLGPDGAWAKVFLAVATSANDIGQVRSVLDQAEDFLHRESENLDFEMLASRRKVGSYDEFSNREN